MTTREITVTGPFQARHYDASLVQTNVHVKGQDRQEIRAILEVREQTHHDVTCWIENETVQCESQSDQAFEILSLTVHLPPQVSLRLRTVSGDLHLEGLVNAPSIRFRTVSGDVSIQTCRAIEEVSGHSVSGDVRMTDCQIRRASIKTVSGDVRLERSTVTELQFDSVSGELRKQEATVGQEQARNIGDLGARLAKKMARHVKIHVNTS